MAKPFDEWTVLPHGKLTRIDDNLLTVTGELNMPPMGAVKRRMTLARLQDGRVVVYSAIALNEPAMLEIEAFGKPSYLIVPNDIHRMDVKSWKERYPAIKVIAPAGAKSKVEQVVPVDSTSVDFGDSSVRVLTVPGTGEHEAALLVETANGTTLVLNDVIFNLENRPGVLGWLFKKAGMTGDAPHIPPVIKMRLVKDKQALSEQLERWSEIPSLKRMLVSHGDIVTSDVNGLLKKIAKELRA